MSRTLRRPRPSYNRVDRGRVRDGAPQYVSSQCRHNNACPWCANGRTHASRRQAPIVEGSHR